MFCMLWVTGYGGCKTTRNAIYLDRSIGICSVLGVKDAKLCVDERNRLPE